MNPAPRAAEADGQRLADGVISHGGALSGSDAKPIACFIRLRREIVGGVRGGAEVNRVFITYLAKARAHLQRRKRAWALGRPANDQASIAPRSVRGMDRLPVSKSITSQIL